MWWIERVIWAFPLQCEPISWLGSASWGSCIWLKVLSRSSRHLDRLVCRGSYLSKLIALMGKRSLACMAAVILKHATIFVFACFPAWTSLFISIVAAFQHIGLVNVPWDVDVFVAHNLSKVVSLRPRRHILSWSNRFKHQIFLANLLLSWFQDTTIIYFLGHLNWGCRIIWLETLLKIVLAVERSHVLPCWVSIVV